MISDQVKKYLEGVEGVVEADAFAKHTLWEHFSREADRAGFGRKAPQILFDWVSAREGYFVQVGKLDDDKPITISIYVDTIDGHRILFWFISGTYADYNQAEAWLTEHVEGYVNRGDADGFHNVISRCGERLTA